MVGIPSPCTMVGIPSPAPWWYPSISAVHAHQCGTCPISAVHAHQWCILANSGVYWPTVVYTGRYERFMARYERFMARYEGYFRLKSG